MTELPVLGSTRTLPEKPAYAEYMRRLVGKVWDIEHYRKEPEPFMLPPVYDHFAVAIDADGRAWIGVARCSWRDQYVRSIGHSLSVSRALAQMARAHGNWAERGSVGPAFTVPKNGTGELLRGVALRDYCREELKRLEVMF